ncbi:winged helix DNA-binding protein [Motilibacter peucedani]|uniref:Winged helix DNA-binding protein n=1 Tax=Motilibacter peucedani TaxID=598650 RepID=A0A420XP78_9ACTN|nr:winged helix DNA-binding domain-containing protein [Motilibacter peucedani]RKS73997.1 winged helix DNA-binding protein [Motilibacter peucedani]
MTGPRPQLSARRLGRATLARQLLLRRERLDVVDAVRRVGALQAQEPASPYLALWNRVEAFDPAELDTAFAERRLVKATLMRITLHAVAAAERAPLHAAVLRTLRASRLADRRFTSTGLTAQDADDALPEVLDLLQQPRTGAEVETALAGHRDPETAKRLWWALKTYAPVRHAPTGGSWSFGRRPAYQAAGEVPGESEQTAGVVHLVRRYLAAFGPATVADVWAFAMVHRPRVRAALEALDDELVRYEGPSGEELVDLAGAALPDEDEPAPPRLLGMWDSALLAHGDRARVVPEEHRRLVGRVNGDSLPTLLVDGRVAGVWRPVEGRVEATAFEPLPAAAWDGLAAEAHVLTALLADREPTAYSRYAHWWAKLPEAAQVRLL